MGAAKGGLGATTEDRNASEACATTETVGRMSANIIPSGTPATFTATEVTRTHVTRMAWYPDRNNSDTVGRILRDVILGRGRP
jgi:hypothetical protein